MYCMEEVLVRLPDIETYIEQNKFEQHLVPQ